MLVVHIAHWKEVHKNVRIFSWITYYWKHALKLTVFVNYKIVSYQIVRIEEKLENTADRYESFIKVKLVKKWTNVGGKTRSQSNLKFI